jgi:hypothetical protein
MHRVKLVFRIAIQLLLISAVNAAVVDTDATPVSTTDRLQMRFVLSEPCSLWNFIEIIAKRPNRTEWLRDWYITQCQSFPDRDDSELLGKINDLLDGRKKAYKFVEPTGRNIGLDDEIALLSADCADLNQLLEKLKPIVEPEDFRTLEQSLKRYEEPYHKLVWLPRLDTLKQQLSEYQSGAKNAKVEERLTAVQRFLNAPWVAGLPFKVVLIPLPVQHKGTHGRSLGAVQNIELLPASVFHDKIDVVFHEACHALWFSNPNFESEEKLFQEPGLGSVPKTELYESMATTLGEGWFMEEAFGKTPKNWYHDQIINSYSHKLLPLYSAYLKEGRQLDAAFCAKSTRIYFENFSYADKDIRQTSLFLVLADGNFVAKTLDSQMRTALPRLREYQSVSIDQSDARKIFDDSDASRAAVLVSTVNLSKLASFGFSSEQIVLLKTVSAKSKKPKIMRVGNKNVLVCVGDSVEERERILFDCMKNKRWPEENH